MTLGWDGERAAVLIEARSLTAEEVQAALAAGAASDGDDEDDDDESTDSESADVLQIHLSPTARCAGSWRRRFGSIEAGATAVPGSVDCR